MVLTSTDGASLCGHQAAVALSFSFSSKAATTLFIARAEAAGRSRSASRPECPTCCSSLTDTASPCRTASATRGCGHARNSRACSRCGTRGGRKDQMRIRGELAGSPHRRPSAPSPRRAATGGRRRRPNRSVRRLAADVVVQQSARRRPVRDRRAARRRASTGGHGAEPTVTMAQLTAPAGRKADPRSGSSRRGAARAARGAVRERGAAGRQPPRSVCPSGGGAGWKAPTAAPRRRAVQAFPAP